MPIPIKSPIPAFKRLFHTNDFSQWEAEIRRNVGTHQSHLRSNAEAFHACCHAAHVGALEILHLQGKGELELKRTQLERGLLWLPLKGVTQERINGTVVQASRGQAILFRPLDQLHGWTTADMSGLSVLLPKHFFTKAAEGKDQDRCGRAGRQPQALLCQERASDKAVITLVLQLSRAIARRDPSSHILASYLLDQLEQNVSATPSPPSKRQSLGAIRRWQVVQDASQWMDAHLTEPFRIGDVAAALGTPTRTIQQAFADELGRAPLAQAKLLRLHALRQHLQDPEQQSLGVATQMANCGLPASGETAQAYRACFGERPSQTKKNGNHRQSQLTTPHTPSTLAF
jgi:AraC-like DNA-binding protein